MSAHSRAVRGSLMRRAKTTPNSTADASTKRTAAKLTGGRSLSPSLMKSQVEPQMQQSSRKTTRAFIRASIREEPGKGKSKKAKERDDGRVGSHRGRLMRAALSAAFSFDFCLFTFAFS